MLKKLQFVTMMTDNGGRQPKTPPKRKCDPTDTSRVKRSRFRLHHTNVSKRVSKMSSQIMLLKAEYLEACPFVAVIIDEGNNWSRACPLYAASMSCDREFRWRIQFVGQKNCEGHKDGEGIWKLVKQIFVAAGLLHVYNKIFAAGTDGASVMRSTHQFRGLIIFFVMLPVLFQCYLTFTNNRTRLQGNAWEIIQRISETRYQR